MTDAANLRMGLKGGFTNYSNNLTQYGIIDPNDQLFQGDVVNKFIPNFGVGFFLFNPMYYVGLSVPKMLNNDITENNPNNFVLQAERRHYFLEGGMVFNVNEYMKFKPTFITKFTGSAGAA